MSTKKSLSDYLIELVDDDQEISGKALKALSNLAPDQQHAFEKAWSDMNIFRRRELVAALAEKSEEDVELDFSGLFMYLLGDTDAEVRATSIDGLWEDESRDFLRKLISLMETDSSETVREKATITISRFALLAELGKLPERWVGRIRDSLMTQARQSQYPLTVGRRAIEGLGYFDTDDEVKNLIAKTYQSDNELLKGSALVAMGRTVDTRWLPEIGRELQSEEPALRYEAARAAGEMGSPELLPPVITLAHDHDSEVRLAAIWALGQIGGQEARRVLTELLESQHETTREAAREAIAEINFNQNPMNVLGD